MTSLNEALVTCCSKITPGLNVSFDFFKAGRFNSYWVEQLDLDVRIWNEKKSKMRLVGLKMYVNFSSVLWCPRVKTSVTPDLANFESSLLGNKFSFKSSPYISWLFGLFWKPLLLSVNSSGHFLGKLGYFLHKFWSHCSSLLSIERVLRLNPTYKY